MQATIGSKPVEVIKDCRKDILTFNATFMLVTLTFLSCGKSHVEDRIQQAGVMMKINLIFIVIVPAKLFLEEHVRKNDPSKEMKSERDF